MNKLDDILCFSGGLDSFIAWHYLGKPPTVYFYTRLPHCEKELRFVTHITEGEVIIDHSLDFSSEKEIYIPHRNLLFASRASVYAQKVWIAGIKDDNVEDKTEEAFDSMTYCLSYIGKEPVVVDSPFWGKTKTQICKWFLQHKMTEHNKQEIGDMLNYLSISCYSGSSDACHMCESCFRKSCAMFNAGMESFFNNESMVEEYKNKALNENYVKERNEDIIRYAEWYMDGIKPL